MPLMLCPNCNASMTAVQRQGVEFDMCPTCRGVWLDRGELEKLIAETRHGAPASAGGEPPRSYERPRYDDRPHDHRRRKKGFDLFDIFD
jgi:Zn-finger nucleic acid-binding protein